MLMPGFGDGGGYPFRLGAFEYPYQMGDYRMKLPEEPTEDDTKDVDSLIGYFQRMAEKYNLKEPKHLFVLRKFGARTWRELNEGG